MQVTVCQKQVSTILRKCYARDLDGSPVKVYSMCPGWVKTEMGGSAAPRTVEQGADTAVWLATETPAPESGKFYRDRKIISY
jgi:short-subunit dehydrogenase